jgi:hypothetical protein
VHVLPGALEQAAPRSSRTSAPTTVEIDLRTDD